MADPAMTRYVLQADQGVPGFGSDVKAGRKSTGGALTVIESRTRGGAPLHVHSREDEYFYVVEGTLTVRCGDDRFEAGPRSFVFLPPRVPHSWDVVGEEATVLLMTVPAMLEEFLGEFHGASGAGARLSPSGTGSGSCARVGSGRRTIYTSVVCSCGRETVRSTVHGAVFHAATVSRSAQPPCPTPIKGYAMLPSISRRRVRWLAAAWARLGAGHASG